MKKMAGSLKLELAQYREMEEFASLGLPLDDSSKFILNKGSRLQVLMKQAQSNPVNITCQLFLLKAGLNNIISDIAVNEINFFENKVRYLMKNKYYNTIINNVINVEVPTDIVVYFINAIKALSKDKESFLQ
jgi:F-type H+-transporting ATPase subunit alpha